METEKVLVEYVRRPVYGQVSKNIMDKILGALPVNSPQESEAITRILKSTINNQKVGVMLANVVHGQVVIGYSQWNQWEDDYDYYTMMDVAVDRAARFYEKAVEKPDFAPRVPYLIAEKLPRFLERCRRYFKDAKMPKWTEQYK